MRNHLTRIERLECLVGTASNTIDAIHIHFIAPSESGPVLVGAHGPIVPGRPDVKPIKVDREPGEAEAEFLARIDRVFGGLQAGVAPPREAKAG